MSSFREMAVPINCGECGARVLVPHVRAGTRLRCPKCGSVLRLPAEMPPADTDASKLFPADAETRPLGSAPTSSMKPSDHLAAEIDELLLADLADAPVRSSLPEASPPAMSPPAMSPPAMSPPAISRPDKSPSDTLSPVKSSPDTSPAATAPADKPPPAVAARAIEADTGSPRDGAVASAAPEDPDEYKLSEALGPLPMPFSLESVALDPHRGVAAPPLTTNPVGAPPHAGPAPAARAGIESGSKSDSIHPKAARNWKQRLIGAAAAALRGEYLESETEKSGTAKAEKFTTHATLDDPRRAFLRGVFEFPFYPDVIPHWIKLAFNSTIVLTLLWWIFAILESVGPELRGGGMHGGIAVGALLLIPPAAFFGSISIVMTWAVGSAIIEDTAAGMKHIENWPESLVLDDLPTLIFPAVALFMAALPAVAINWLANHGLPQIWFLGPILVVLLFPFVLLSILETGSIISPVSKPIVRCVRSRPGVWLWFYGESTAILGLAVWLGVALWLQGSWPRFALAAVLVNAAILIYFRLLGRLGLVCANQSLQWEDEGADYADEEIEETDLPRRAKESSQAKPVGPAIARSGKQFSTRDTGALDEWLTQSDQQRPGRKDR